MTKKRIHDVLVRLRKLSWAARELGVNKGTLHRYLIGERPAGGCVDLQERAERLARRLAGEGRKKQK